MERPILTAPPVTKAVGMAILLLFLCYDQLLTLPLTLNWVALPKTNLN
jgi:hypothetical protein